MDQQKGAIVPIQALLLRMSEALDSPVARSADAAPPERTAGLAALQAITAGEAAVRIALIDGFVDVAHPALQGARLHVLAPTAFAPSDGAALRHGTQVASILFGQPGSPVLGVAPHCTGLIIPVFEDSDDGIVPCSQARLAEAIRTALVHGAHVINISAGEGLRDAPVDDRLIDAIGACAARNVLVVAAAGNDGCDCRHVPASLASVLAVGAAGTDGQPLAISNWGGEYDRRGLLAPGEHVLCAEAGGGTAHMSGTSAATPLVAGVAALLLSLQWSRGQRLNPGHVGQELLDRAIPCDPRRFTQCHRHLAGTLSIQSIVKSLQEGTPAMSNISQDPMPTFSDEPGLSSTVDESVSPTSSSISPSSCGCGCKDSGPIARPAPPPTTAASPARVYALGALGYDFGTESHRDAFAQSMPPDANSPHAPTHVLEHLRQHPHEAQSLIWTLNIDATPVYAIAPSGAYAATVFDRLREFFDAQVAGRARIMSVPGHLAGQVRLQSGQFVPLLVPALRGMYCWSTEHIVEQAVGQRPDDSSSQDEFDRRAQWLRNFLSRVYFDLRNLGQKPEDRALNFSATNAFQAAQVMREVAMDEQSELNTISVRKSPICRPDSDCYDVQLRFFNAQNTHMADRVFRFTVDVSGLVPVSIGQLRSWYER